MRPLGFLLAIVTGSTLALSIGLFLTWVVILFLPDNAHTGDDQYITLFRPDGECAVDRSGSARLRAFNGNGGARYRRLIRL